MTISFKHTTQAVGTDAGNGEIRKAQWNEEHSLTMAANFILGRATAGTGAVEEIACTAAGRALLDDADASAQRTTLGLAIGTDVQAYDADLSAIAGLAGTSGLLRKTAANTWSLETSDYEVKAGYLAVTSAGGTTTLTASDPRYIVVTGTLTQTIVLPAVSTLTLGTSYIIHNLSSGQVTIQSSGLNTITSPVQNHAYELRSIATSGTGAAVWQARAAGTTSITGSGNIIGGFRPTIQQLQVTSSTSFSAGTNSQGQGTLSENVNVITTAASNPSGVTLPAAGGFGTTSSRILVLVNKGANPVNVYPATGGQIDALGTNVALSLPVNGFVMFFAASGTQWYSTVNSVESLSFASGTLAVANGGTGATDATTARTNLGAAAASHTHPQSDITNLTTDLAAKANLASPTFTGTPAAPTPAANTNTTQLATTAFVLGQGNSTAGTIAMNGTQAAGSSNLYARADHVHPTDTSRAPLNSPTFTGTPAAPTAATGTNTTQLATTAFVQAAIAAAKSTQTYTSGSGNYTVPTGATFVFVRVWGGGGSGQNNPGAINTSGGSGGGYIQRLYTVTELGGAGASVAYAVGAGGVAIAANVTAAGNPGGNSTFGSGATLITAYGGNGSATPGGGGAFGAGTLGGGASSAASATMPWGGGAGTTSATTTAGSSIYGGAGGGGGASTNNNGTGGSSLFGGNGGNGGSSSVAATSGAAPGGGGGGARSTTTPSGAGGAGRIELYAW